MMCRWGKWSIAAIAISLGACTLANVNFGGSEGPVVEQMTTNIFGIKSSASATVESVLLKAAQTTKKVGATHFKLISADDAGRPLDVTTQGSANSPAEARAGQSYAGTPASPSIKPGQDTYIRVFRLMPGQEPPAGYFDAEEIIALMGRRAKPG
jgi:hypothetical protein